MLTSLIALAIVASSCDNKLKPNADMQEKVDAFIEVELTTDISHLSENQKKMLPLLFEAAQIMDDIFWMQAYGDK